MMLRTFVAMLLCLSLAACVYIVNDRRVLTPVAVPVCGPNTDLKFPAMPPIPKLPAKGRTSAEINETILINNIQELRDYSREVQRIAEEHVRNCQVH